MAPERIELSDFQRVELRVGRVERCEPFPEARKPALRLWIDFGAPLGVLRSSAGITDRYTPESLEGSLVIAVTNLPPRQVANFLSEVLVLGVPDADGRIVLLAPDGEVPPGVRVS